MSESSELSGSLDITIRELRGLEVSEQLSMTEQAEDVSDNSGGGVLVLERVEQGDGVVQLFMFS